MESLENNYSLNKPITNEPVLARERKTTNVTGQYGSSQVRSFDVGNSTVLSAQPIQSSDRSSSVHPLSTLKCRQLTYQQTDGLDKRFENNSYLKDQERKAVGRPHFSCRAVSILEIAYQKSHYIDRKMVEYIAKEAGITPAQVRCWFSNRRMKRKMDIEKLKHVNMGDIPLDKNEKCGFILTKFKLWMRVELESIFKESEYISRDGLFFLARRYGFSLFKIENWFKEKRRGERKKNNSDERLKDQYYDYSSGKVFPESELLSEMYKCKMLGKQSRRCKKLQMFTEYQKNFLHEFYKKCQFPCVADISAIALKLDCSEFRIKERFSYERRIGLKNTECLKKEYSCVLGERSANVTSNKAGKSFDGSQVQRSHKSTGPVPSAVQGVDWPMPSAALGAPLPFADCVFELLSSVLLVRESSPFGTDTTDPKNTQTIL